MKYESMVDRLIANTYMDDNECWIWVGSTKVNAGGQRYGKLNYRPKRGPRKGRVVTLQAHRVSYATLCINPGHLIKGSQRDNVKDCVKRGRHRNQYSEVL